MFAHKIISSLFCFSMIQATSSSSLYDDNYMQNCDCEYENASINYPLQCEYKNASINYQLVGNEHNLQKSSNAKAEISCIIKKIEKICKFEVDFGSYVFNTNNKVKKTEQKRIQIFKLLHNAYFLLPPVFELRNKYKELLDKNDFTNCYNFLLSIDNEKNKQEQVLINFCTYLNFFQINQKSDISLKYNIEQILFFKSDAIFEKKYDMSKHNCFVLHLKNQSNKSFNRLYTPNNNSISVQIINKKTLYLPCEVLDLNKWLNYSCIYHNHFITLLSSFSLPNDILMLCKEWLKCYEELQNLKIDFNENSILKLKIFSFYIISIVIAPEQQTTNKTSICKMISELFVSNNHDSVEKICALLLKLTSAK